MSGPELVQFADLTQAHFARQPLWIQVHTADYDEPWYSDSDEETFRPRSGPLPASASEGMLLVSASFTLADGTQQRGFVTPAAQQKGSEADLGLVQPHLFLPGGGWASFWGGLAGIRGEDKARFYRLLERSGEAVFPIRYRTLPGLVDPAEAGEIRGFYTHRLLRSPKVEM